MSDTPRRKHSKAQEVQVIEPVRSVTSPYEKQPAVWFPTELLVPWKDNPRKNDGRPVEAVAQSIKRFGFASPIIAREANKQVIAGHTRLKAAQMLGLDVVPVRFLDVDPVEARLLALADNKIGELADWDAPVLKRIAQTMDEEDLLLAGFDSDDLSDLLDDVPEFLPDDAGLEGLDEVKTYQCPHCAGEFTMEDIS